MKSNHQSSAGFLGNNEAEDEHIDCQCYACRDTEIKHQQHQKAADEYYGVSEETVMIPVKVKVYTNIGIIHSFTPITITEEMVEKEMRKKKPSTKNSDSFISYDDERRKDSLGLEVYTDSLEGTR
jgi:hypothetical protein